MKHFLCYSLLLVCINAFSQSDSSSTKSTSTSTTPTVVLTDSMMVNNIPDSLLKKKSKHVYELLSVELGPGFTLPAGNFASGDHNNILAGYAKEGFSIAGNVYIKVIDKVNAMVSYAREMNTFDRTSFEANALHGTKNYSVNTRSNWISNFMLVGASGQFALDEENFLTPRLQFGLCIVKTPSYESVATATNVVGAPLTVDSKREMKFAFRLGVGLRKYINKTFYLSLNPDFFHVSIKNNINQPYFTAQTASYQNISVINLNVGVGFRMY
jgi:hypothetical protein